MNRETILFVGPSGAGKDTVAERIALLTGAELISLSTQVRKEAKKAGLIDPTRGDLQLFANHMRELHGKDVFAKLASQDLTAKSGHPILVNDVRHPDEIQAFDHPTVIGVDASKETRFKRVLARARPSDPKNWQDFLICDERENGKPDNKCGQQNFQCLARADIRIINDSDSLENLEYAVDQLVDRLLTGKNLAPLREIQPRGEGTVKKLMMVTNGPHGAGKTTISRIVSDRLSVPYMDEIGGNLRQEVRYNALESSAYFDREVMRRELLRDHQLLRGTSPAFILETWHTGNIAYVLQRTPELARTYIAELRKQLLRFEVMHLLLVISDDNFIKRATEKVADKAELLGFYENITAHTRKLYQLLNLNSHEICNDGNLDCTCSEALQLASAHFG